jgi:DNA topoisomerase-1
LLRELGPHPQGGTVGLYRGRYGPYVSHDGVIASLPKGADPDAFALDAAMALLAAQKAKGKTRRPARRAAGAASNGAAKPARRTAAKRVPAKATRKPAAKAKPAARPGRPPA